MLVQTRGEKPRANISRAYASHICAESYAESLPEVSRRLLVGDVTVTHRSRYLALHVRVDGRPDEARVVADLPGHVPHQHCDQVT